MQNDIIASAVKAAPPVTVSSVSLTGVELPDMVMILTAIYTILQAVFLIRDKLFPPKPPTKTDADDAA